MSQRDSHRNYEHLTREGLERELDHWQDIYVSACSKVIRMGVTSFGTLDDGLDTLSARLSERVTPEQEGPIPPADFVCLKATRCKVPCGDRRCHVAVPTEPATSAECVVDAMERGEMCPENMMACDMGCTGGWCVTMFGSRGSAELDPVSLGAKRVPAQPCVVDAMEIAHIVMGFHNENEQTHYRMLCEIEKLIANAPKIAKESD